MPGVSWSAKLLFLVFVHKLKFVFLRTIINTTTIIPIVNTIDTETLLAIAMVSVLLALLLVGYNGTTSTKILRG